MVLETSLGELSVQGQLTAFKTDAYAAARTGILTLVTLTGSLTITGTGTSTFPVSFLNGTRSRGKFMELHRVDILLTE
jgi:hypothetical protein